MISSEHKAQIISAVRRASRDQIMPRFRSLAADEISTKSGPTDLVTLADTMAEAQIIDDLSRAWPEARVLGEETVAANPAFRAEMGTADWAVVVDPVDGTWNYAKGLSTFGVILAVLRKGTPVFSILYDPVMDDWIEASLGAGTEMVSGNGRRLGLSTSSENSNARMNGYISLGLFSKPDRARIVETFPDFARVTSLRCSCHEYRMLAQGHVEFCLSGPIPHPWDHAAGALAVTQAGGVVRFLDGDDYRADRVKGVILAAGSQRVWDSLADRFSFLV